MKQIMSYLFFFMLLSVYAKVNIKAATFIELSQEVGIDFIYESKSLMGGGVAFFDYNNDYHLDIYLTGGKKRDVLYHNNGDGTFTDISQQANLQSTAMYVTTGVATADIDNDGFRDIFVTTWYDTSRVCCKNKWFNGSADLLLYNNGDGTFENISMQAGIVDTAWSMGASFGDYNLDGFLDIYVANYLQYSSVTDVSFNHRGYQNHFYLNNGDKTFTNIAAELEVADTGCSLAAAFTDYNNDTYPDIYVANDFGEYVSPNTLYQNQYPNLTFIDNSKPANADLRMYGMGIAIGDYDEDEDLDYYITNIGKNAFLQNQGDGTFKEIAQLLGIDNTFSDNGLFATGWGTVFFDYDNDTYLDLYVSNGHMPAISIIENAVEDADKLYQNKGNPSFDFEDVSEKEGIIHTDISRGCAYADYDNDGDNDLLTVIINDANTDEILLPLMVNDHVLLHQNQTNLQENANWIKIQLEGTNSNRDAFGAKIKLKTANRTFVREIDGGSSHASQNSSIAHFGLVNYTQIDEIEIIWPGGKKQYLSHVAVNQHLHIQQDKTQQQRPSNIEIKAYLEGAFNEQTQQMNTHLQEKQLLPLTQPYASPPFLYKENNYTTKIHPLNNDHFPIVDWLLVELRDANNLDTIIAQKTALLLANGQIVDAHPMTTKGVNFYNLPPSSSCYIVLRHRNHSDVISQQPIQLPNQTSYDFTQQQSQQQGVAPNKYALFAGDANADGIISVRDFNRYFDNQNTQDTTYTNTDFNLDGNTSAKDKLLYQYNASTIGHPFIRLY